MFGEVRDFLVIFLFQNILLNGAVGAHGVGGLERVVKVHIWLLSSCGQGQRKNGSGILKP